MTGKCSRVMVISVPTPAPAVNFSGALPTWSLLELQGQRGHRGHLGRLPLELEPTFIIDL